MPTSAIQWRLPSGNARCIRTLPRARVRALPRFTSGTIGLSCRCGARTHLGVKGKTPEVKVPGQRESISAASAVNAKGAFGFTPYKGGLNAKRFVDFLRQLMKYRKKPLELILDSLPAHKGPKVRAYTESLNGKFNSSTCRVMRLNSIQTNGCGAT